MRLKLTVLPRVLTLLHPDERFLCKEIPRTEMDAFSSFAPAYFQYMTECLRDGVSGAGRLYSRTLTDWCPWLDTATNDPGTYSV